MYVVLLNITTIYKTQFISKNWYRISTIANKLINNEIKQVFYAIYLICFNKYKCVSH